LPSWQTADDGRLSNPFYSSVQRVQKLIRTYRSNINRWHRAGFARSDGTSISSSDTPIPMATRPVENQDLTLSLRAGAVVPLTTSGLAAISIPLPKFGRNFLGQNSEVNDSVIVRPNPASSFRQTDHCVLVRWNGISHFNRRPLEGQQDWESSSRGLAKCRSFGGQGTKAMAGQIRQLEERSGISNC